MPLSPLLLLTLLICPLQALSALFAPIHKTPNNKPLLQTCKIGGRRKRGPSSRMPCVHEDMSQQTAPNHARHHAHLHARLSTDRGGFQRETECTNSIYSAAKHLNPLCLQNPGSESLAVQSPGGSGMVPDSEFEPVGVKTQFTPMVTDIVFRFVLFLSVVQLWR